MANYKKINKPNYIDASISTLIKDIPQIITNNNKENLLLFDSIFNFGDDSAVTESKQYIKTSLHTDGYVIANSGEFKNIKFDKIDASTVANAFINNNVIVDHNYAINRFKSGNAFNNNMNIVDYAHNSAAIYHNGTSLDNIISSLEELSTSQNILINDMSTRIDNIKLSLDNLYDNLNINRDYPSISTPSISTATYSLRKSSIDTELYNTELVSTYNNSTNSYTYPQKTYSGDKSVKYQTDYDYIDIINNVKFRYYNVNSIYTKVNNQFMNSLNTNEISTQTNIIIDKTHDTDLIIKLYYDGEYYTCVKVLNNDIDLCRLLLTCVDITSYGPKWYILNYSGNIEIIKIKDNQ